MVSFTCEEPPAEAPIDVKGRLHIDLNPIQEIARSGEAYYIPITIKGEAEGKQTPPAETGAFTQQPDGTETSPGNPAPTPAKPSGKTCYVGSGSHTITYSDPGLNYLFSRVKGDKPITNDETLLKNYNVMDKTNSIAKYASMVSFVKTEAPAQLADWVKQKEFMSGTCETLETCNDAGGYAFPSETNKNAIGCYTQPKDVRCCVLPPEKKEEAAPAGTETPASTTQNAVTKNMKVGDEVTLANGYKVKLTYIHTPGGLLERKAFFAVYYPTKTQIDGTKSKTGIEVDCYVDSLRNIPGFLSSGRTNGRTDPFNAFDASMGEGESSTCADSVKIRLVSFTARDEEGIRIPDTIKVSLENLFYNNANWLKTSGPAYGINLKATATKYKEYEFKVGDMVLLSNGWSLQLVAKDPKRLFAVREAIFSVRNKYGEKVDCNWGFGEAIDVTAGHSEVCQHVKVTLNEFDNERNSVYLDVQEW